MTPLTIRKHGSYIRPMAATALFRSSSRNLHTTTACLKPERLRQERGTWRSISRKKRYSCHYPTASPHRHRRHKPRILEASSYPEPSGFLSLACRNHIGHATLPDALFAALARGHDRVRRKGRDGGGVCWQLARQGLKKCHHVARFGVAQRPPELHPRLRKRRHRSIVKIGRRHRDIPQAGNTENIKVVGILGDIGASVVDGLAARCLPIGLNDAKFSIHSAANEDTVVARYAAGIDEGIKAAASFERQCIDVASEVAIKRRWCHQGPLVCPDGLGNVLARQVEASAVLGRDGAVQIDVFANEWGGDTGPCADRRPARANAIHAPEARFISEHDAQPPPAPGRSPPSFLHSIRKA